MKKNDNLNIDEAMQKAGFSHNLELQTILDTIIANDAPFADLKKGDATIDELLFCDEYNIKSCLLGYYRELTQYKIDVLLDKAGTSLRVFFEILNAQCRYISENTNKPILLQNKITELLQESDKYIGFGQVFQILILRGILKWFENCNINKNDAGDTGIADMYKFVHEQFIKVCVFYFIHFNNDENSRPLDEYLATNEIYQCIVNVWNKDKHKPEHLPNNETTAKNVQAKSEYLPETTPPQTQSNKNESTPKPQRIINTEELGTYFKPIFKGMGNGNINFFNFFIEELKTNRSAKEFAQIALMCWEGKQMGNKKPKTFSKWYGIFCECVHCEKKTYKPNQLMPVPKNIISLFPYLQ